MLRQLDLRRLAGMDVAQHAGHAQAAPAVETRAAAAAEPAVASVCADAAGSPAPTCRVPARRGAPPPSAPEGRPDGPRTGRSATTVRASPAGWPSSAATRGLMKKSSVPAVRSKCASDDASSARSKRSASSFASATACFSTCTSVSEPHSIAGRPAASGQARSVARNQRHAPLARAHATLAGARARSSSARARAGARWRPGRRDGRAGQSRRRRRAARRRRSRGAPCSAASTRPVRWPGRAAIPLRRGLRRCAADRARRGSSGRVRLAQTVPDGRWRAARRVAPLNRMSRRARQRGDASLQCPAPSIELHGQ